MVNNIKRFSIIGDDHGVEINMTLTDGSVFHQTYDENEIGGDAVSVAAFREYVRNHDNTLELDGKSDEDVKVEFDYRDKNNNVNHQVINLEKSMPGRAGLFYGRRASDGAYRSFYYDMIEGQVKFD